MRNVSVEYRFENVRIAPSSSEWATIEGVLKRYVKTVEAEVVKERRVGDTSFRSYRTRIVVPDLAAFESIHADLEALRLSPRSEQRVDYRFDGITAAYRSSYVTAGVSAVVSGFTVEGNRVKIFTQPKGEAIATNTVRPGMWSARLDGVPEERWVYGVSEDPKGVLPRRYFRVNVTTLQTENLEQSAFEGWYGGPVK
jgi:hypothetical protein